MISGFEIGVFGLIISSYRRSNVRTCSALNKAFVVLLGDVGGTMSLDEGMSSLNKRFTRSHSSSFCVGKFAGVATEFLNFNLI